MNYISDQNKTWNNSDWLNFSLVAKEIVFPSQRQEGPG